MEFFTTATLGIILGFAICFLLICVFSVFMCFTEVFNALFVFHRTARHSLDKHN